MMLESTVIDVYEQRECFMTCVHADELSECISDGTFDEMLAQWLRY